MPLGRAAGEHPYFALDEGRPLVMAHRGGGGLWPENTLYAFERAAEIGADVIETEIHSTADNNLVLIHDATVDRTTNGTGQVNSFTLRELKRFDAGYHWTADGGQTFPFRGKGITVPTLEEVFTALPDTRINIDLKQISPTLASQLCVMLHSFDMVGKVMVASFSTKALGDFRQVCSGVATSASKREVTLFFLMNLIFLGAAYGPPCHALQIPEYSSGMHVLTKRFLQTAHSHNLKVHVWTVNQVEDMKRLLDLGVDGIITDHPDRLISVLTDMRSKV
jgi:glycerophosphoryl diester phosphodiesterase